MGKRHRREVANAEYQNQTHEQSDDRRVEKCTRCGADTRVSNNYTGFKFMCRKCREGGQ